MANDGGVCPVFPSSEQPVAAHSRPAPRTCKNRRSAIMTERGLSVIRKLSTAASSRALRIRRYAPHTRGAEGHSPSETPPTMRNPRCGGHSVPLRHSSLFPHLQTLDHAPLRRRYRMLDDTNITNDSGNNKFGRMFLRAMAAFRREGPFSSLPLSSAAGLSARGHAAASGFGEGAEVRERRKGLAENPRP